MQKDITEIKRELRCVWEDIGKLDRRLTAQEERATKLSKDGGTTMTNRESAVWPKTLFTIPAGCSRERKS
jgi:hypothetical protein